MSVRRTTYRFGCYVLDLGRLVLIGPGGAEVPLRPKAFDVLHYLVENAGRVVSRDELLRAVWPGLHINEDGITQCVREVRRALGDEAQQLVRTVAKRGYLLAAQVAPPEPPQGVGRAEPVGQAEVGAAVAAPDLAVARAPRLSLAVLPFANSSGDVGQDYLADAVTDDLTTDLSRLDGAFVIARSSAQAYAGRPTGARQIGAELGVRYLVQGTVRQVGNGKVRVNAQLVSTETGACLWADRLDQDIQGLGDGPGEIARRLANVLGTHLVEVESERSLRERPDDPDASDLVLRARSLLNCALTLDQAREAEALLERALPLDPRSVPAMVHLAYCLMSQNDAMEQWLHSNKLRALALLEAAERLRPGALEVVALRGAMLLWQGRYAEGSAVYERVLAMDVNYINAYHQIGAAKLWSGEPEAALPFYHEALRRDPLGPGVFFRYGVIGYAYLLARQPAEAIPWLQRSIHENPARHEFTSLRPRAYLASALALVGKTGQARQEVAEVVRLAPTWTARSWDMRQWQRSRLGEQLRHVSDGLRLAGLRDHADEAADSSVPSTAELHGAGAGPTPLEVPGGTTLRTEALQRLLAEERPLVLDVNTIGWSLPGAVVLRLDLSGGTLDDDVQDRLRRRVLALTNGDKARPIVVLGWNAERWEARNAALRLLAMGCTRVHWYRGGKEVWSAHGLPEADAEIEDV